MNTDKTSTDALIDRLVQIESHVHYSESPPPDVEPFVCIARDSSVLISAPHGTRTFRNSAKEAWHEEDEYTAGMALLLAEQCAVSVITNVWRSDYCDPNHHSEDMCSYKRAMRKLAEQQNTRWVVDLHGASENSEPLGASLVDLGTRKTKQSLGDQHRNKLEELIESVFGKGSASRNGFAAMDPNRITAFCQDELKVQAIQIEMKPSVRVPIRRTDASVFAKLGAYSAPPGNVWKMLGVLADFVRYLQSQ